MKSRILALALIIVGVALVWLSWHQLATEGQYSMKMAAFGPLIAIGGLYLMIFPSRSGKPNTTGEKIALLVVFVIGLLAGLVNWYLMDPGFFGR
ncbi:MAG TPA: hypothetical protein VJT50_12330 [Pyrinomonadaceae bacterium]|nr:hypothetical protein [Pyrinomonadaceae bacterium]